MSIQKSYAVFGLGRYGMSVARELVENGADVLAVDLNPAVVNAAAADIPFCKCADVTDAEVIRQLGVSSIDVVVVAMASSLEAAVMTIMLCKEAGVKTVIAKCSNEMHRKILTKVGADKVVLPEFESGVRLAKNLLSSGFVDMVELSDGVSLIETDVKPEWQGRSLAELDLRKKYGFNVVAIRRGDAVEVSVDPNAPLLAEMKLIVIADRKMLGKFKA